MEQAFYIVAMIWMVGYALIAGYKALRSVQRAKTEEFRRLKRPLGDESDPVHPDYLKFLKGIKAYEDEHGKLSWKRPLWAKAYGRPFPLPYPITSLPEPRPVPPVTHLS